MYKMMAGPEQMHFDSTIFNLARNGDVDLLLEELARSPHLIDAPNPNYENQTPMHAAAARGWANVIEALVEGGSKAVDTSDDHGRTPMHHAVYRGNAGSVSTLVRLGNWAGGVIALGEQANRQKKRKIAVIVGVLEALVRAGSRAIDTPDRDGYTPMHRAAELGRAELIETLVRLRSEAIDSQTTKGRSPVECAAAAGQLENLQLLKNLGAKTGGIPVEGLSEGMIRVLGSPANEDEVADVRYRVYFASSLMNRLLFEL